MKIAIALILMAGCGATPVGQPDDPHELVACDSTWPPADARCELACASFPQPMASPPTCKITIYESPPQSSFCSAATEAAFDGVIGCCHVSGTAAQLDDTAVRFLECQP